MYRIRFMAAYAAVLVNFACQQAALGQQSAPVVEMRQPIATVAHTSRCNACGAQSNGVVTGSAPVADCPACVEHLAPAAAEHPDAAGSGIHCVLPGCESRMTGVALASNLVLCDSANCASPATCTGCSPGCDDSTCDQGGCDGSGAGCAPLGRNQLSCSAGSKCNCQSRCNNNCGGQCGLAECAPWSWECSNLCRDQSFWIRADYLLWWVQDDNLPTLVSSSPLGTPINDAGVLGLPTTSAVSGGSFFGDLRQGGRIQFGRQLNDHVALDGSIWGLENERESPSWFSTGDPILARPFFNADPSVNAEDAELVSFSGELDGQIRVNSSSEIYGGNLSLLCNKFCCADPCSGSSRRFDLLAGYRYLRLREGVRITENLTTTSTSGPLAQGTQIDLYDDFRTRNEFHGGELGGMLSSQHGRWTTQVLGKVAIGNLARQVRIDGGTTVTVPSVAPVSSTGGLLTQSTNIGTYEDDVFTFIPEFQTNVGYQLTCNLGLQIGYTFMFLPDAVRPSDAIDRTVNGTLLGGNFSGPSRPQFSWADSDLWVMGLNMGLQYTF